MSDGWLDKAKEEAKKLAEAAKNADYGAMLDKTKAMAQQATEEAKKAASSVSSAMQKPAANTAAPSTPIDESKLNQCLQQLKVVENLLQEIKATLKG